MAAIPKKYTCWHVTTKSGEKPTIETREKNVGGIDGVRERERECACVCVRFKERKN